LKLENRRTPLYDFHIDHGARMVPFSGWDMPVQYPAGIKAEHLACRTSAALFDVSHMAQIELLGKDADAFMERLTPTDLSILKDGHVRYSVLLSAHGGVLDDLMMARLDGALHLVVNAGRADHDIAHLQTNLAQLQSNKDSMECEMTVHHERALLALQGPAAAAVLRDFGLDLDGFGFMAIRRFVLDGVDCVITRSGYTGEDGFEISLPATAAAAIAARLTARDDVFLAGLGARDTLRMEAGLPLWGHELDETINPVSAGIGFVLQKRRREAADFPGAEQILNDLNNGPAQRLVGLLPVGGRPVRDGVELMHDGAIIGKVTSGGFAPSLNVPAAMGFVAAALATPGTNLVAATRGTETAITVTSLPLVPNRYFRG
jgi:aminomethyltransferase